MELCFHRINNSCASVLRDCCNGEEVLHKPWCVGEMTNARLRNIDTILVLCFSKMTTLMEVKPISSTTFTMLLGFQHFRRDDLSH